jgi:hypothetical protein
VAIHPVSVFSLITNGESSIADSALAARPVAEADGGGTVWATAVLISSSAPNLDNGWVVMGEGYFSDADVVRGNHGGKSGHGFIGTALGRD